MKLAIDNDFFCKTELLEVADLILKSFSTAREECFILRTLLRHFEQKRGKCYRAHAPFGDFLLRQARAYQTLPDEGMQWMERMVGVDDIDPGEATLLAYVASTDAILLATHDKKCLRALKRVDGLTDAIEGRVLLVESALLHMCTEHGVDHMHKHVSAQLGKVADNALKSCFGGSVSSVVVGLNHYIDELRRDSDERILWRP